MMIGPGDPEQVIRALKDAFVQGRLTKDEFDVRVSKALATYAELDALIADIPAGRTEAPVPEPARESHNRKLVRRGTAAGAATIMVFTAAAVAVAGGNLAAGLILVPLAGFGVAVLLAVLLTFLSWALETGSGRQATQGSPPSADVKAAGRAKRAGQPGPGRHGPRHIAEAARIRLQRPRRVSFGN